MPFNAVAKGFVYFFNAGICVPGLRDIFATGKPLNDNDALLYPIVSPEKKIGESMVWKTCALPPGHICMCLSDANRCWPMLCAMLQGACSPFLWRS